MRQRKVRVPGLPELGRLFPAAGSGSPMSRSAACPPMAGLAAGPSDILGRTTGSFQLVSQQQS